ncbi:hypothetical protein [Haloplanus aerogenes]|uniref:Uncharacterized protein n=2 Tax=Haloplanus aerogenes TaxID=660522 RepID=A0A3M0DQA0_9EURY|nr:hypothetical protein [Haloplanus aerogenes]AZH24505.1 hypothetical protein DU502_03505 [Haloplanus aerogenes]RMB23847.1 hypothetical protein ATH50_1077 [Haloplanus aerogenes]
MDLVSIRRVLDSPAPLLGGSALVDLVVRLPEDVLAPLVSVTGGFLGSPAVGFVTTWVMFAVALYTFCHLAYDHVDVLPADAVGFRTVFTACAVALAVGILRVDRFVVLFLLFLPGLFLSGGALLGYLVRYHEWDVTDDAGRGVSLIQFVTPHADDTASELATDLAYDGWLGRLAATCYVLALTAILGLPILFAAFATHVLLYAFPIPDLLFLGWASAVRVLPRLDIGPNRPRVLRLEFAFDRFLIDTIEHATRCIQGMIVTGFVFFGLLFAAGYLFVAVTAIGPVAVEMVGFVVGIEGTLLLWAWGGALLTTTFAGCHGLWVWIRELRRLPQFLDIWEGRTLAADDRTPSRVTGFVAVSLVCWLSTAAFVVDGVLGYRQYAVLWPALVLVGIWTIHHTVRRSAQPVTVEHGWITAGLVVQPVAFVAGTSAGSVAAALSDPDALLSVLTPPIAVAILLLIVAAIPVVTRYDDAGDGTRYGIVGLLFVLGCLAAGGSTVVPPPYRFAALVLWAMGWGFAVFLGAVRYFDL